jgi:hypothetical protein
MKMRRLISTCLILAVSGSASAHTLAEEAGTIAQLAHQLFGSHHMPLVLLLLAVGLLVLRARRESNSD